MSQSVLRRKIAIVGCGPVGMLGSLLFQNLGIEYIALQKYPSPRSHPSAHWLSANSKAILSQIPNLNDKINNRQQSWQNFRYYRYLQNLFGHQIGITDQFKPLIQQKLKKSIQLFGETPNHIPQNVLLQTMYENIKNKQNLVFGKQIKDIRNSQNKKQYTLYDQNNNPIVQAKHIILCSGVNTNLRNKLPTPLSQFHMQGTNNLMNVINIHFTSKQLANRLKQKNHNAMLHFIYSKKIIAILVNHSIDNTGTFVLQIPNYQPFVDLLEIYSSRELIEMMFQNYQVRDGYLNDLSVVHVGKWKLQGILAYQMYKNNIFLAGDAGHAYPPAGGFGMNSGFQDINELAHSIYLTQKNPQIDERKIFSHYSENRKRVNSEYLRKAMQNYQITKHISISLGYSPNILDYFSNSTIVSTFLSLLPQNKSQTLQAIRLKAMKLMYRRPLYEKNPGLHLFFDQFDYSIQKLSKIRKSIMKDIQKKKFQTPNFYARQGDITKQQIYKVVGKVKQENIKFYKKTKLGFQNGQKLISSDGNVILM